MDLRPSEAQRTQWLLMLRLALPLLVLIAFFPSLQNDFIGFDDPDYVTENPVVQRGLTWEGLRWSLTATAASNWHPVTWWSHLLDVQFFGLNAAGHHATSLGIHALNALLAFELLLALTGAPGRSWFVAALFALHPLRVESVAWVAERKDVLAAFFWLLTTISYLHWVHSSNGSDRRRWIGLTHLLFAIGLMCKPMLVTLPFTLVLLDFWPLRRIGPGKLGPLFREKTGLLALAVFSSIITFVVQRGAGAVNAAMAPGFRLMHVLGAYGSYGLSLIWPHDLAFFYPLPAAWPMGLVLAGLLLLVAIGVGVWRWRNSQPWLLVGGLWFVGTLVPVIGIVAVGQQATADRYTYLPSFGFFLAVVWVLHAAAEARHLRTAAVGVGALVVAICALVTHQQVGIWRDTATLCRRAIAVTKGNHVAYDLLGVALFRSGHFTEALGAHQEALRLNPGSATVHNNAGVALQALARYDEARSEYAIALKLRPNYAEAYYNLASVEDRTGKAAEAEQHYAQAIALRPDYAAAHYNLGVLLLRLQHWDEARRHLLRTLELLPDSAEALNNLGVIATNQRQFNEAIQYYERAIQLKADDPRFFLNAGACLQQKGNLAGAMKCYEEALRLRPDFAEARANLQELRELQSNMPKP